MKYLFALLTLSFGFMASAQVPEPAKPWRLVFRVYENAKGSTEFFALQQKYPQLIGSQEPSQVVTAQIQISTYKFDGETACSPDDARLTFRQNFFQVCTSETCEVSAVLLPSSQDPCTGN